MDNAHEAGWAGQVAARLYAAAATVTSLAGRPGYHPDMRAVARNQVRASRESLGLDRERYALLLAPLLGWTPTAAQIRSWETRVCPPGDVVLAAALVRSPGAGGLSQAPRS